MDYKSTHRGIPYSVRAMGERRWKWEITPPDCIQGLYRQSGETAGLSADAVMAAKKAIERQTMQFTH